MRWRRQKRDAPTTTKTLGTLMVNELAWNVERIWCEKGQIRIWATRPGPIKADVAEMGVLFGIDGEEVMLCRVEFDIPKMGTYGNVDIDLPMEIIGKENDYTRPRRDGK